MNDDITILPQTGYFPHPQSQDQELLVIVLNGLGEQLGAYQFANAFQIGRSDDNDIKINHDLISRHHLKISLEQANWWLEDLQSTNGVYINQHKITEKQLLQFPITIKIGTANYFLHLSKPTVDATVLLEANAQPETTPSTTEADNELTHSSANLSETNRNSLDSVTNEPQTPLPSTLTAANLKDRLLAGDDTEDMGDRTLFLRKIIREDRQSRSKNYKKLISVLSVLILGISGFLIHQYLALQDAKQLAINMFYDIKAIEVNMSQAELRLDDGVKAMDLALQSIKGEQMKLAQDRLKLEIQNQAEEKQRLQEEREKLKQMKAKYQEYLKTIVTLKINFPTNAEYEKGLMIKVASGFGESELELPDDFTNEVQKYIKLWQSSGRLANALKRMEDNHYDKVVFEALNKQDLPIYLFYLPLQESNFDPLAIGPETRFGFAKGAWQLLSSTASEFGLTIGPLAASKEYDFQDARFDFFQATQAGTRFLKHIYSKQAQASGLLVVASYNYGHNKVTELIAGMPNNPRDRNFWKFIKQYEIPKETYDYVLYIFSAAVIGEDPKHFGFDFNPPVYFAKEAK